MIAGSVTMYLVAKAQDSGVKCLCFPSNLYPPTHFFLAAEWRSDARNPYAAQLAQSALH